MTPYGSTTLYGHIRQFYVSNNSSKRISCFGAEHRTYPLQDTPWQAQCVVLSSWSHIFLYAGRNDPMLRNFPARVSRGKTTYLVVISTYGLEPHGLEKGTPFLVHGNIQSKRYFYE